MVIYNSNACIMARNSVNKGVHTLFWLIMDREMVTHTIDFK